MTDDMSTPSGPRNFAAEIEFDQADPVATAEEFAAETDKVSGEDWQFIERENKLRDLGQWLVAEARWQRDELGRDAERQHAQYEEACELIDSQRRVISDLTRQLDMAYVGATQNYVHDDRVAITRPGDFLAWLFGLDAGERLKTAERILRQADEAGRCFFEDHAGRIAGLEGHIELLQQGRASAARPPSPTPRLSEVLTDLNDGVAPGARPHNCENGNRCVWNTETGLHADGTPCRYASVHVMAQYARDNAAAGQPSEITGEQTEST